VLIFSVFTVLLFVYVVHVLKYRVQLSWAMYFHMKWMCVKSWLLWGCCSFLLCKEKAGLQ